MAEYPYSPNPASVPRFLDHIASEGKPQKVTQKYLESVGFKSTNDRKLIGIFKAIGFLDSSGAPTAHWQDYRDKNKARKVLAAAIRNAYSELFTTLPDADRKDNEALLNFFRAHTDHAQSTLGKVVNTFKALCERADFGAAPLPTGDPSSDGAASKAEPLVAAPQGTTAPTAPSIHINIELHLPPTDDGSVYEKLFAAMKKHLNL